MKTNRIRVITVVLSLVVILMAFALYGKLFSGEVRQREVSPDRENIAECIEYADLSTVQIRTRLNPFRHIVISSLYDAGLSVVWVDSRNLLVQCKRCGELSIVGKKETTWHDISIHYAAQFSF
jgi:hypothetical protein